MSMMKRYIEDLLERYAFGLPLSPKEEEDVERLINQGVEIP